MPSTLPLPFRSAVALSAAIRDREVGCLELLDLYLDRVARINPRLNAIIHLDAEGARERARAADAALAKGEVWGPLHGVPMTLKESYNVTGMPTTWGLVEHRNNVAAENAVAVDRLLGAGVVIFGKTNVPVMLADYQSYNPVYGSTNNPWDLGRTPGGSSGGSAAALAAGLTGLEAGSDIGSSIRNPAHYCGVFGHKPSYGIVPLRGHALPGSLAPADISVVGPLARSAEDLALALDVMAGPDPQEAAGWRLDLPAARGQRFGDFRVAVMLTDPNCAGDGEMLTVLQALVERIGKTGARVDERARPDIDMRRSHDVFIALLRAATSGRQSAEAIRVNEAARAGLDPADRSYYAQMVRANTMAHREWLGWNNERAHLRERWREFFRDWDVLLCPVAASAAFPHDQKGERWERTVPIDGRREPATDQLFWAGLGGVAYLPSTVVPAGLTRSGLPVGIQIVGPYLEDRTALAFGRLIEREIGGFVPPPGYE